MGVLFTRDYGSVKSYWLWWGMPHGGLVLHVPGGWAMVAPCRPWCGRAQGGGKTRTEDLEGKLEEAGDVVDVDKVHVADCWVARPEGAHDVAALCGRPGQPRPRA